MIVFALLAIVVFAATVGDISAAHGMKSVGDISSFRAVSLISIMGQAVQNGFVWLGISCKGIALFGFLALLSRADVSWVVPAVATSYVVETLAAKYLLGENVNRSRWAGVLCVCLGVILITL